MTAPSSASVRIRILSMGTCRQCGSWSGHNHRLGETPYVQVSTTWVLTCLETVHQSPCMTREMETRLSYSRVSNNSVVEHRSRRPVLSPDQTIHSLLITGFLHQLSSLGLHPSRPGLQNKKPRAQVEQMQQLLLKN